LWGKYKQKKNINFNLPKQTLYVAILIGFIITTNDLTSIYMFKTGADLSISMPIFTAGNVFLTIIFGLLVMKEKINIKQFCGLISIVGGIILLNV
jgi:multidrug transporter EmrE-like cation transporter